MSDEQSPVAWSALVEAASKSPALPSTGARMPSVPAPTGPGAEVPYATLPNGAGSAAFRAPPPPALWYNPHAAPYGVPASYAGPVASTSQPVAPPAPPVINPGARKTKRRQSKAASSGDESEEGDADAAVTKKRVKISRACDGCASQSASRSASACA